MPVYFVGNGNGQVKIGHSKEPLIRLAGLQTASPHKLELLAVVPGTEKVEAELHRKFATFRLSGEWFQLSDQLKLEIELAQKYYAFGENYQPDSKERQIWEDAYADWRAESDKLNDTYDARIAELEKEIERLDEERDRKDEELERIFDEKTEGINPWWVLMEAEARNA